MQWQPQLSPCLYTPSIASAYNECPISAVDHVVADATADAVSSNASTHAVADAATNVASNAVPNAPSNAVASSATFTNATQPQPMAVPGVNNQPYVPVASAYTPGVQPMPGQNYSSVLQSGQPYIQAPPTYMAQPGIQ